jgi:hypothetical protein
MLSKAIGIWLILVIVAIGNAMIRERLLAPAIGAELALPASGVLLSLFIFVVAFVAVPFFGSTENKAYVFVGILWFALTFAFEFVFGRFVAGKPWHEIVQVFDITRGNLFILALLATLISPWLSARLRGLI